MLKSFLAVNSFILSVTLAVFQPVKAFEVLQETVTITPVSQFSDVQFTDWAFVSLQSLVEKYSCITGYPDHLFRGNRVMTRYEFAAGLNTCISTISQQFGSQLSLIAPEDVTTIKRLEYEFSTELATIENRVENLEVNSAVLRSQQFSTTTKVSTSVVVLASGITGDSADADPETSIDSNLALNYRTRLNLISSFTGQDRLLVRLQSANRVPNFNGASATNMTRQSFEVGNSDSSLNLNLLEYRFPVAEDLNFYLYGNAASHHYYATVVNPDFASFGGAKGSPSRFSERNPIYRIGFMSPAGVAAVYNNRTIRLDVGYLAENAETGVEGLFGGNYSALAQFSFKPSPNTEFGLTYIRSYVPDGNLLHRTGSDFANIPFGAGVPLMVNAYGVQALWRITPKMAVSSWIGYMNAERVDGVNGNANIINYAVNLAFPDLFKEKAVGGIGFGMPPKVTNNTINSREDRGTGLHFEAFYQYPLTENITIIPGIIYLTQPNHNDVNGDIFFGNIRTVFNF